MTDATPAQPAALALGIQQASAWVRFLRSYGPTPENGTLFDEHVTKALAKANVQAINLPTPRLDDTCSCTNADAWLWCDAWCSLHRT